MSDDVKRVGKHYCDEVEFSIWEEDDDGSHALLPWEDYDRLRAERQVANEQRDQAQRWYREKCAEVGRLKDALIYVVNVGSGEAKRHALNTLREYGDE